MTSEQTAPSSLSAGERARNMARVADQAAETALCHLVHVNGYCLSAEQFEATWVDMAAALAVAMVRAESVSMGLGS